MALLILAQVFITLTMTLLMTGIFTALAVGFAPGWDGTQFRCDCGWRSALPADFVSEYRQKWGLGA
jgi:hypothetical protein